MTQAPRTQGSKYDGNRTVPVKGFGRLSKEREEEELKKIAEELLPMFFCLGQHGALRAMWRDCCREKYLDDLHVVCQPHRVGDVHTAVGQELWKHSSLHHGKTKDACATLTARLVDPRAVLRRGDTSLPRLEQGLVILGIRKGPVGEEDNGAQRVQNPSGMVVAHFCAAARANFIMRTVRPELAEAFATPERQRAGVFGFSSECGCRARAQIRADDDQPSMGGVGFRSVVKTLPSLSGPFGQTPWPWCKECTQKCSDLR